MQRILSVEEMRNADKFTIENLGVEANILVERAGSSVAEEISKKFKGGRTLIVLGKGSNGKDARVVFHKLSMIHGFSLMLMECEENELFKLDYEYDLIIDGIFGTGLNREVTGIYKKIIEKINSKKAYKISIDIPSGLNGNNGKPMGVAVKANLVIAIGELKTGYYLNDGLDYSKKIICKDIGISIWGEDYPFLIEEKDIERFFPERKRNTNKGSYGKACVIGGSRDYFGSVLLSGNGLASLKLGTGYSNICVPDSLFDIYAGKVPECTMSTFNDKNGDIVFNEDNIKKEFKNSSIAIGMGLKVSEETYKAVSYIIENYNGKLLIDADGLNSLAKYGKDVLKNKKCEIILTPHIKEFSRLIGKEIDEILDNPIAISKNFAEEYGVTLLLKNATTIITDGEKTAINITGNSGMAKCGSGDVLSGIITGLMARGINTFDSGIVGAFIFGKAGEFAIKNSNEYCITAMDIIKEIPSVINDL